MFTFVRELSEPNIGISVNKISGRRKIRQTITDDQLTDLYNKEYEIDYDGETEEFDEECKMFMSNFVDEIFQANGYLTQEDKAKFGLLVQHQEGRSWFSKLVDSKRVHIQEVNEFAFYRLVQYFAVCLFECNLSDDYSPATTLLNMCFTYNFTSTIFTGNEKAQGPKQFVYEYLKEQPIWKSNRFWNSAFLLAIHVDRKKRNCGLPGWKALDYEQKKEFEVGEENSAFAHLASFLYMMSALGVSKDYREEFRDKMSTIGNLREEQIKELEDSIEILD